MLLSQVSELKTELVRRGSPKNILNDVTSKLTEIKNTVTSMKDGTSLGQTHKQHPPSPFHEHLVQTVHTPPVSHLHMHGA
jgi:hypothetical protein